MRVSRFFSTLGGIFTVAILTAGLVAGVALVGQNQEIRKRASEAKEHKVNICHKTGSEKNQWVQIEISENAKESHLAHGDIEGNCPSQSDKGDDKKDKDSGGTGGVNLASSVTVNNQVVAASEVRVETKYVYITSQFDFWISFQGINSKKPDKLVRVIFRKGDDELHVYNKVQVVADAKGIYHGTITDIKPGTYDVLIKSEGYLQRKFEKTALKKGRNNYRWDKTQLLVGDFDSDNKIDSKDISELMSFYTQDINPVNEDNKIFDVDLNGLIEAADFNVVFGNLGNLYLEGED